MHVSRELTQAEIDAAIVACLRIFAARGRAVRQQREKPANVQQLSESAPCIPDAPDRNGACSGTVREQPRAEESDKNPDCP